MSPGNAHPYSWSSIINGCYDAAEITAAGYPAVAAYLIANKDTIGLNNAKVTHVWTQDASNSRSIAKSASIQHVVENMEDMIGQVDAILLNRDDPGNHVLMAKPFIDAGIPIFIDKPLAYTIEDLAYFSSEVQKGKFIMSCSSQRYANELRVIKQDMPNMGDIQFVTAVGPKDWEKYGVHMVEGICALLDDMNPISVTNIGEEEKEIVVITFENGIKAVIFLYMDIAPTFQVSVFGNRAWRMGEIKNSYSEFRDNIIEFIRSVEEGKSRLDFSKTEKIIKIVIAGFESLKKSGKEIKIEDLCI